MAFQYWKGVYKQEEEWLFMRVDSDGTRGNGFKFRQGRFRLDTGRKFFTHRVVTQWNRLPKEVLDAPCLEAFKARLDVALGSLGCCKMGRLVALHVAGGLEVHDPGSPFQPWPFCDSVILSSVIRSMLFKVEMHFDAVMVMF